MRGARLDRLQAEVGQRADVDEVEVRMRAHLLVVAGHRRAVARGEALGRVAIDVRADVQLVAEALVDLCVQVRDGAGPDDADSHV